MVRALDRAAVQVTGRWLGRRVSAALSIVVAPLLLSACGPGAGTRATRPVVTDSAGVRIVSSPMEMAAPERWTVGPDPEVRIGAVDGGPGQDLFRVSGAVRLPDGRIVVGNDGSHEVRWFDQAGKFLFAKGGEGDGPGEYHRIRSVLRIRGDSVLVTDDFRDMVRVYDADGELTRSWTIESLQPYVAPPPFVRLRDGSFAAHTSLNIDEAPGVLRSQQLVVRYRDGSVEDTMVTASGLEFYTTPCGADNRAMCSYPVPYGPASLAAATESRIMVADGEAYSISVFDTTGRLTAIYRRPGGRRAMTQADGQRFIDSLAETAPSERRARLHATMDEIPLPDSMPSFVGLRTDDEEDLWVELPFPEADGRTDWDVFDGTGALRARAVLPAGFAITSIADGYVVGVAKDESDVEYVLVLPIRKAANPAAAS